MIPPTSIDGTDITGATIDGTDVQEITVDGQTVFSAEASLQDIVAPGNLIAWFPFENGGNDETRTGGILDNAGISVGDSTDYSGSLSGGGSFDSGDGIFDLNAGANSIGLDSGSGDGFISNFSSGSTLGSLRSSEYSVCFWVNTSDYNSLMDIREIRSEGARLFVLAVDSSGIVGKGPASGVFMESSTDIRGSYHHIAITADGPSPANGTLYIDGTQEDTGTLENSTRSANSDRLTIGARSGDTGTLKDIIDGLFDDVRIYDKELSSSEVSNIYQNTAP